MNSYKLFNSALCALVALWCLRMAVVSYEYRKIEAVFGTLNADRWLNKILPDYKDFLGVLAMCILLIEGIYIWLFK